MKPRAVVIGESLIDIVERPHEPAVEIPGGSPLNVAVGLSRLGRRTSLVTWIGNDPRGEIIRQHCISSNVRLAGGSDNAQHTSTALAHLDVNGHADYEFDIEWEVPPLPEHLTPHVLHTGSIGALLQPGSDDVLAMVREAADSATITYDPNLRPSILGEPQSVEARVLELVGLSDVVKVSAEDLEWLYPAEDVTTVAARWATKGPALVVLTLGPQGDIAFTSSGMRVDDMAAPATVVDTVGAGDSFMAGLIDALWRRKLMGAKHRDDLHAISEASLRSVLEEASLVAAVTVSRPGANPPWLAELPEVFESTPSDE